MIETWKEIKGFEGKYAVSNLGNVKRLERYKRCGVSGRTILNERPMKPYKNHNGYYRVCLWDCGKHNMRFIHRLVAEAFLPKESVLPVDTFLPVQYVTTLPADAAKYVTIFLVVVWSTMLQLVAVLRAYLLYIVLHANPQ